MYSVGIPGVLLALLLKFTVKEPVRTQSQPQSESQASHAPSAQKASVTASLKTLLKVPTWWGMALGISFGSFGNYAISTWVIDYYVRAFAGLDITQLLIVFGIINGTAYAAGVWLGGYVADKWGKKNKKSVCVIAGYRINYWRARLLLFVASTRLVVVCGVNGLFIIYQRFVLRTKLRNGTNSSTA